MITPYHASADYLKRAAFSNMKIEYNNAVGDAKPPLNFSSLPLVSLQNKPSPLKAVFPHHHRPRALPADGCVMRIWAIPRPGYRCFGGFRRRRVISKFQCYHARFQPINVIFNT